MAAVIDTAFLASTYALPEVTFTTLINAPTQDLVLALLQQLVLAASQFESAKSEKLRTDLELEAAVRGGEARAKQIKESFDKTLKELESLKRQLNDAGKLDAVTVRGCINQK
jgi:nucleoprotein TPR